MRFLYIFVVIFIFSSKAIAFENVFIPNENSSYTQFQNLISNEELESLENQILKKNFKNDPPLKRLARLEKEIFGMEQNGDIENRFENLLTASEYYKSGYRQGQNTPQNDNDVQYYTYKAPSNNYNNSITDESYKNKYYPKNEKIPTEYSSSQKDNKQSKIKQFFEDLAEILSAGVVTGYTPPVYNNSFDILGSDIITGYPQIAPIQTYVNIPTSTNFYNHVHMPYNRYYPYYRNNYYLPNPSPNYRYYKNRLHNHKTRNSPGIRNYGAGSRVRIIN